MSDRRKYISPAVDAVLEWWLTGMRDEALLEWWASDEAPGTALELVHVMLQAIEHAGYEVVRVGEETP